MMKESNKVQANNAFVDAEGKKILGMMGNRPGMPADCGKMQANMSNDGMKAQNFARKLTAGMDKKAFPVK